MGWLQLRGSRTFSLKTNALPAELKGYPPNYVVLHVIGAWHNMY